MMVVADAMPAAGLRQLEQEAIAALRSFTAQYPVVTLKGNKHLRLEHWQKLARPMGMGVRIIESRYVDNGKVQGWEARAVVIDRVSGLEIGGAEGMCGNDEARWKNAPQQQMRSMAGTRAASKALKLQLGDLAVQAGFSATPAEEMLVEPEPATVIRLNTDPNAKIGDGKRRKFCQIAKRAGHTEENVLGWLKAQYAIERTEDIPERLYEELCLAAGTPGELPK